MRNRRAIIFALFPALLAAQNTAVYPGAAATTSDLFVATNTAQSTLTTNLSSGGTTINVVNGSQFTVPGLITINSEVIAICAHTSNTLTVGRSACPNIDGRGFDGTSAVSHLSGQTVAGRIVAWQHNQLAAEVIGIEGHAIPVWNVKAYGAYCDNLHDDYAAITSAIAAAGVNHSVYFPGHCLTSATLKPLDGQLWTGTSPSFQFVTGQTTLGPYGTFTPNTPLIDNPNHSADIKNFWIKNMGLEGGSLANPVVSWYRMNKGGMSDIIMSCAYAGCNGLVGDAGAGQSYNNHFSRIKGDGIPGSAFLFQNGSNGAFLDNCLVINPSGVAGVTYGVRFTTLAADSGVSHCDFEDMGHGTGIYIDAPTNWVGNLTKFENMDKGIEIAYDDPTNNGSGTIVDKSTTMTTSVVTPVTIATQLAGAVHVQFVYGGTGNTIDYFGYSHHNVTTSGVGTTDDWGVVTQTNTANAIYRLCYDNGNLNTSGIRRVELYQGNGTSNRTFYVDCATGDFFGAHGTFTLLTATGAGVFGGTRTLNLLPDQALSGEQPAGALIKSNGTNGIMIEGGDGSAGAIAGFQYFDGTIPRSAVEIANTGAGFGTLKLMRSGGTVNVGGMLQSAGTTFGVSGCSADTKVGGNQAGSFIGHSSATCTFVITPGQTAAHGWSCSASDITTGTTLAQSASSTTTCSVFGPITTGDKVQFHSMAF